MTTKLDIDELERNAQEMSQWEDDDLASDQACVICLCEVHTPPDLEPSPLCNPCAQRMASRMPYAVARIRQLEAELARAAGVARAHGSHAYADDFMRVAQDREDFDVEVRGQR